MSISGALGAANSGLQAAQTRAQTAAHNVANAHTDGYSKQIVRTASGSNGVAGVTVTGVDRAGQTRYTDARMGLETELGFTRQKAETATALARILGEPGSPDGLTGQYGRLENALRDAAASPEDVNAQRDVLAAGRSLIVTFGTASETAIGERLKVEREIGRSVDTVNDILGRLDQLNEQGRGGDTPDLADGRQRLLDELNRYLPITSRTEAGRTEVMTTTGRFLLTDRPHELKFDAHRAILPGDRLGDPLSGLTIDGLDVTPTGEGTQRLRTGILAAQFEARDVTIPTFQTQIDDLAADLVNRFAAPDVDPTTPDGTAGLFVAGPGLPGMGQIGTAGRLALNAAVDPNQGGALHRVRDGMGATVPGAVSNGDLLNRMVGAMGDLRDGGPAFGGLGRTDAVGLVTSLVADTSAEVQRRGNDLLFFETRYDAAKAVEDGARGVDTDEELQDLLSIEQAFAANARVISTISAMIDELMRIGR